MKTDILLNLSSNVANLLRIGNSCDLDLQAADMIYEMVALVRSYARQDELIGTEFEGVDEVTEVIRLLKLQLAETTRQLSVERARCQRILNVLKSATAWIRRAGGDCVNLDALIAREGAA